MWDSFCDWCRAAWGWATEEWGQNIVWPLAIMLVVYVSRRGLKRLSAAASAEREARAMARKYHVELAQALQCANANHVGRTDAALLGVVKLSDLYDEIAAARSSFIVAIVQMWSLYITWQLLSVGNGYHAWPSLLMAAFWAQALYSVRKCGKWVQHCVQVASEFNTELRGILLEPTRAAIKRGQLAAGVKEDAE